MNAQSGSKGIALFSSWGWVVNSMPQPLYPPVYPGTQCIGKCVGPRTSLNGCKNSSLLGFDPPTVQFVVSSYTECTILAHSNQKEVGQKPKKI